MNLSDFVLYEKVSPECLDKFRDKIPAELLRIWENYGFGTFFGGYLKIINPDDYMELLKESYFRADIAVPVMATAFGDLITWEKNQFVGIVYYRYGVSKIMIRDFDLFLMLLQDKTFKKQFFALEAFEKSVECYGALDFGECFGYVPLLAMGGSEKLENLKKVRIREHIALITDMTGGV